MLILSVSSYPNYKEAIVKKAPSHPEVEKMITKKAIESRVKVDLALKIAECESGFDPTNKNSVSTAKGVYQFVNSTWAGTPEGIAGVSVLNGEANITAAIRILSTKGTADWEADPKSYECWKDSK